MNDYLMRGIPAYLVASMWHYAAPYVKRALDHTSGELTHEDVRSLCENRDVQLWLISHGNRAVGAVTTEIVVYPHRKHCRVITLAGSQFAEWIGLVDKTLVDWAREQGCDALEAHVRRGFVPKLADIGYRHKHSVVVKELDHEQQHSEREASTG